MPAPARAGEIVVKFPTPSSGAYRNAPWPVMNWSSSPSAVQPVPPLLENTMRGSASGRMFDAYRRSELFGSTAKIPTPPVCPPALSMRVHVAPVVPLVFQSSSKVVVPMVRSLHVPDCTKNVGVPGDPAVSATCTAHAVAGAPGMAVQVTVGAVMSDVNHMPVDVRITYCLSATRAIPSDGRKATIVPVGCDAAASWPPPTRPGPRRKTTVTPP